MNAMDSFALVLGVSFALGLLLIAAVVVAQTVLGRRRTAAMVVARIVAAESQAVRDARHQGAVRAIRASTAHLAAAVADPERLRPRGGDRRAR